MNFKITIYNSKIYKEIVLEDSAAGLLIGTGRNCQVQLLKDDFDRDFVIALKNNNGDLELTSEADIQFLTDGGLAEPRADLKFGSVVRTVFADDGSELLNFECAVDFDMVPANYNLVINISGQKSISIGGANNCNIRFFDRELKDGYVVLSKSALGYKVDDSHLEYGATINGILHKDQDFILKNKNFLGIYGYSFYLDGDMLYTSDKTGIATNFNHQLIEANNIHFH